MQIDTAIVGVMVTVLLALLGFASWVGALHQKVTSNRDYISNIDKQLNAFQADNKADHIAIDSKLDKIIQNGKGA